MRVSLIAWVVSLVLVVSCTPTSESGSSSSWVGSMADDGSATTRESDPEDSDGETDSLRKERPDSEPTWREGSYFPRFPETDRVYVFRLPMPLSDHRHGAVDPSWRIDQSDVIMMNLTLVGMQGVINRSKPSVYVEWYDPLIPELTESAAEWTFLMERRVAVQRVDLEVEGAIEFLMERFSDWFSGIVVYDPDVPDTINLATMIAGLEDRIIMAPDQIGMSAVPAFDSITDLRDVVRAEGWDSSEESKHRIYTWVYDNLWPRLDHRMIGVVSPGPPTSREGVAGSGRYYQLDVTPRDYLVALRVPVLWLSPEDEPDASLFNRFLADAPAPIPLTGVFAGMEHSTVKIAAEHGDFMAGINWPSGWIGTGGLSALSGITSEPETYEAEINPQRILSTINASHVVASTSSDGDAIYYLMGGGFGPRFGWNYVQDQRFGWTISPLLSDIAPLLWNHYVEHRSVVSLLGGVAGVGYTFPEFMDDEQLDRYLGGSAAYLASTGLRTLTIPAKNHLELEVATRYYRWLHDAGYLGAIVDWRFSQHNLSFAFADVPAPIVWSRVPPINDDNLTEAVDTIMSWRNQLYADLPVFGAGSAVPVDDADAHGGQAALIPRSFAGSEDPTVILAHSIGLLPGEYRLRVRLKVADNRSRVRMGELILVEASNARVLASREISPSDFASSGVYQTLEMPFAVPAVTDSVEVRVVYEGGTTDLYADLVETSQQSPSEFPVFAMVGIDNIGVAQARTPEKFNLAIERRGGVVLSPNEFMAALNPEYMVEFATSLLGPGNEALARARTLLDGGDYFGSLVTTRRALAKWLDR